VGFAIVISQPPVVLFIVFIAYAVSGPTMTLIHLRRRRAERKAISKGSGSSDGE